MWTSVSAPTANRPSNSRVMRTPFGSRLPKGVRITREFDGRFAVGAETEVHINVQNAQPHSLSLSIKDENPPKMKRSGLREASLQIDGQTSAALVYGLTPPKRGRFEFGQIAVRFLQRWTW